MNHKSVGEKGQNCVIGELSKLNIKVGIMLSDNLPFDLILLYKNKLIKAQIKTSTRNNKNSIYFDFTTNNWYKKETYTYTKNDCDIIIGYDIILNKMYLFSKKEFTNKKSLTIRNNKTKNNQSIGVNDQKKYFFTLKRLNKILK